MRRIRRVAVIRCNGSAAFLPGTEEMRGNGNCSAMKVAFPVEAGTCSYGCLGGGSCVRVCKFDAVSIKENSAAEVDRSICVGCGKCVKACPQHLIELVAVENVIQPFCANEDPGKKVRMICESGCIGCGICEKFCPAAAITVTDSHAVIDQSRCIACGMCAAKCPRGVIHDANGIISNR